MRVRDTMRTISLCAGQPPGMAHGLPRSGKITICELISGGVLLKLSPDAGPCFCCDSGGWLGFHVGSPAFPLPAQYFHNPPPWQVINILSTWGDAHYVGLTGIEMMDSYGNPIVLDDVYSQVVADPPSVNVLPGYGGSDPRTVDKLFNGVNYTCDDSQMWLTPFTPGRSHTISVRFRKTVRLSCIRFWNYNKSRVHSGRGAQYIEITLDGRIIFKGEISRAPGECEGSEEATECILFASDDALLAKVDQYFALRSAEHREQSSRGPGAKGGSGHPHGDDSQHYMERPPTRGSMSDGDEGAANCSQYGGAGSGHNGGMGLRGGPEEEELDPEEEAMAILYGPQGGSPGEGSGRHPRSRYVSKGPASQAQGPSHPAEAPQWPVHESRSSLASQQAAMSRPFTAAGPRSAANDGAPGGRNRVGQPMAGSGFDAVPGGGMGGGSLVSELMFTVLSSWTTAAPVVGLTGFQVLDSQGRPISPTAMRVSVRQSLTSMAEEDAGEETGGSPWRGGSGGASDHVAAVLASCAETLVDGHNVTDDSARMALLPIHQHLLTQHKGVLTVRPGGGGGICPPIIVTLVPPTHVSSVRFWNYNAGVEESFIGAKRVAIAADGHNLSPANGHLLRKAPGTCCFDFGQTIPLFACGEGTGASNGGRAVPHRAIATPSVRGSSGSSTARSMVMGDCVTPIHPCGFIFKLELLSNYGDPYFIGLNGIELYDETDCAIEVDMTNGGWHVGCVLEGRGTCPTVRDLRMVAWPHIDVCMLCGSIGMLKSSTSSSIHQHYPLPNL
eukprot:jgi/Mesvir1/12041/Mv00327-RA.2